MQLSKIIIGGILTSYRPLKDRSFNLSIHTSELNAEQKVIIDSLYDKAIFLFMKEAEQEITDSEVDILDELDEIDIDLERKTLSQRLRSVLFVLWKQKPEGFKEFKDFYSFKMVGIITKIKNLLEPS